MAQLSSISRVKVRNGDSRRVKLMLDGEKWLSCLDVIVSEFGLCKGEELSDERKGEIEARVAELDALSYCHRSIAQRQLSEKELRDRLAKREYSDGVIEYAIERANSLGLLNDTLYAQSFVRGRLAKGHGARRIQHDLRRKGIDQQTAADVMDELIDDDAIGDTCRRLLEKRFGRRDLGDPKERNRAMGYLQRRGYSFDEINRALSAVQAN